VPHFYYFTSFNSQSMIKFIFNTLILFSVVQSYGQIDQIPDAFGAPLRKKEAAIEGEVYYNSEWNKGDVEWQNATVGKNLFIKYNTYSKKVEIQNEGKVWEFSAKEIKSFQYDVNQYPDVKSVKFRNASFFFPGEEGFVAVLYQDKIAVVEKVKVELISGGASYGTSESTTKIIQHPRLFVILPDGKATSIKRSNGGLSKAFKNLKLGEYLKANNLDVDEEEDFMAALKYINNGY
jgi:hypothetical protein